MFQDRYWRETRLYHVPFPFNVYMDAVMKEVKMGMESMGMASCMQMTCFCVASSKKT